MPNGNNATAGEPDRSYFPYAFTPVGRLPRHLRFRAEGRPPSACVWGVVRYFRKYFQKLRLAPPEEVAYFREQRRLLQALSVRPEAAADVRLAMVGDIMWLGDGWSGFLADDVRDHMNAHDVVLGNLETTIARSFRVSRPLRDFAWFNSDPALLMSFHRPDGRNTFTALGLANNHTLDYRDVGVRDTMQFLDEQRILHSGVREAPDDPGYVTFSAGGIRIGFYAATWGLNDAKRQRKSSLTINTLRGIAPEGVSLPDLSEIRSVLDAMAADGVGFRIIALHWGHEYELYPTPEIMQVAREIVRAGADVILGTHPHVQQPSEVCFLNGYERTCGDLGDLPALRHPTGCVMEDAAGRPRKALVLYSLGNFTTRMMTFLCRLGLIQSLSLRRDPQTGFVDWSHLRGRLVCNVPKDPATAARHLVFLTEREAALDKRGEREWADLNERIAIGPPGDEGEPREPKETA